MSFFYFLDSRIKLLFIFMFSFLVFLVDKLPVAACLLLFIIIIRLVSRVPFGGFRLVKNLALLAVIILVMQMLFGPGNSYIVKPLFPSSFPVLGGMGSLKWDGFFLGVLVIIRLACLMILLPVFTETTSPYRISQGLCALGFNYRISFIITTAFNLVPLFKNEALVIIDAQRLRGSKGRGIKAYVSLLVPLMLGAMRKAQMSSAAMDARAFGIYKTRTWLCKPSMEKKDYFFFTGIIIYSIFMIIINFIF
jgi:energy-coupling factor transport system permease protein